MFSLFRARVICYLTFLYYYHVRTLEGVTVIHLGEGSCLAPKYRCCCLKLVFSLVFKYNFTERVFLNNLLDACGEKKKNKKIKKKNKIYIYIYIYIQYFKFQN